MARLCEATGVSLPRWGVANGQLEIGIGIGYWQQFHILKVKCGVPVVSFLKTHGYKRTPARRFVTAPIDIARQMCYNALVSLTRKAKCNDNYIHHAH